MPDSLKILAGNKPSMPVLADREPAYCKDEKALYIGTSNGNVRLCSADDGARITQVEERASALETASGTHAAQIAELETSVAGKLTATAAAAQSDIAVQAELTDVIAAHNALLAALRAGGIML